MELSYVTTRAISDASKSKRFNAGIRAMRQRREAFDSEEAMMLAGIGVMPEARAMLNDRFTDYWTGARYFPPGDRPEEIVVGGGLHAAIYCAVRYQKTGIRPVVFEPETPGGNFAMTIHRPAFKLNSENNPGKVAGVPDKFRQQNLNYIPGAPIQVSDISGEDFPNNTDLAYIIRVMLAKYADVYNERVTEIDEFSPSVTLATGEVIYAGERVIDARGLGNPNGEPNGVNVLSFKQFMQRMETDFPLAGMRRVAVIGGKDSGASAIKRLLGVGPSTPGMSTTSIDRVESVDWYNRNTPGTQREFRDSVRTVYSGIARYLPQNFGEPARLQVVPRRAGTVQQSYRSVLINGVPYDTAIVCTGYSLPSIGQSSYYDLTPVNDAYRYGSVYRIGAAGRFPFTETEEAQPYTANPDNIAAIFRLGVRTASIANRL